MPNCVIWRIFGCVVPRMPGVSAVTHSEFLLIIGNYVAYSNRMFLSSSCRCNFKYYPFVIYNTGCLWTCPLKPMKWIAMFVITSSERFSRNVQWLRCYKMTENYCINTSIASFYYYIRNIVFSLLHFTSIKLCQSVMLWQTTDRNSFLCSYQYNAVTIIYITFDWHAYFSLVVS